MARVKELTFSFSRKMSDGNYGSLMFEAAETVELDATDDVAQAANEQRHRVIGRVMNEINNLNGTN